MRDILSVISVVAFLSNFEAIHSLRIKRETSLSSEQLEETTETQIIAEAKSESTSSEEEDEVLNHVINRSSSGSGENDDDDEEDDEESSSSSSSEEDDEDSTNIATKVNETVSTSDHQYHLEVKEAGYQDYFDRNEGAELEHIQLFDSSSEEDADSNSTSTSREERDDSLPPQTWKFAEGLGKDILKWKCHSKEGFTGSLPLKIVTTTAKCVALEIQTAECYTACYFSEMGDWVDGKYNARNARETLTPMFELPRGEDLLEQWLQGNQECYKEFVKEGKTFPKDFTGTCRTFAHYSKCIAKSRKCAKN